MDRNLYFIGIAFFGMINGIRSFNPMYLARLRLFDPAAWRAPLFGSTSLIAYFASLMLSTATIILAGIPAAIYERFIGAKDDSTEVSLWIWLAGTALLTLPAIGNFFNSASSSLARRAPSTPDTGRQCVLAGTDRGFGVGTFGKGVRRDAGTAIAISNSGAGVVRKERP